VPDSAAEDCRVKTEEEFGKLICTFRLPDTVDAVVPKISLHHISFDRSTKGKHIAALGAEHDVMHVHRARQTA
jgi:hypothetical protein